jgi:hypothetical protein
METSNSHNELTSNVKTWKQQTKKKPVFTSLQKTQRIAQEYLKMQKNLKM